MIDKFIHETNLPDLDLNQLGIKNKNVLFIFPHPDDETIHAGGLIQEMIRHQANVFTVSITKGEHGDEILKLPPEQLGKIRHDEYVKIMNELGVQNYEMLNFKDGDCVNSKEEIKQKIKSYIVQNKIELIVTYEKSGIYEHTDHILLSEIIFEIGNEVEDIKILYVTISKKVAMKIKLPLHMANHEDVQNTPPQFKLKLDKDLLNNKYRLAKFYKSQKLGYGWPLWTYIQLFGNYEYFTFDYK